MYWQELYQQKLTAADQAVRQIKSGDRVVVAHATGEPTVLIDEMVKNASQYENVEMIHMVAMGAAEYCKPEFSKNFHHNSLFVGNSTRQAVAEGRAEFTPVFFSEIPQWLRTELWPDVALIHVSPPDEHGYCSFGISVDYTKPAAECAKTVIAQVNPQMPRTLGDSFISVEDIDYIVEADAPLIELAPPKLTEVEMAIGRNCASLVRDGDTLQLGIGAIPDAVLMCLKDKKDLGIHSEMFSDGVVDLVEAGVITNRRKNVNPGKSVAAFLMGTRRLYDYVDNNPAVAMYPVDYVNDPRVICRNDNLVSINSCVQVDLMGQVVSSSVGLKQISGVGGQVDFVRGANMSRGGRTIMAMPSTAAHGKFSKIIPFLDKGAAVTTSRNDVDYVVTEYGIAQLRWKTLRDRAKALIGIAHPDFRPRLLQEFETRFR
ncbi:acetyl-CoA hydrolase/transferase family protein [Caproiciproducens sp.]